MQHLRFATHLLNLWIFLFRVVAQISKVVLKRLEELLCLLRSGCTAPHERHSFRLKSSDEDLRLGKDWTDHQIF